MKSSDYYTYEELEQKAKALFAEERAMKRLDGWFLAREIAEKIPSFPGNGAPLPF